MISVVVPVYQGGDAFRRCLTALSQATPAPDEVIVVIDGPDPDSAHIAKDYDLTMIQLEHNVGPAQARNIGAQHANSDILFFVDADVEIQSYTIAQVLDQFQASSELSALIGSYDDSPAATNFLSQYKNLFHHYTHQTASETAFTFWGACGAIRQSVFKAVDGFDPSCRQCIEDIELGYRLKQAGYHIRLCKEIQVKHLKRWNPLSLLKAEIFYRALPWTALILRQQQLEADLNLDYRNRFSVILIFSLLGSLIALPFNSWVAFITLILAIIILIINLSIYHFFYRKRGLLFTLKVIPWHWFYFFYGGATFAYGLLIHYGKRFGSSQNLHP